jgi:hypothetical protein
MSYCPACGARLADGATECFQCHARLQDTPSAGDVRRQARRGALQGTLIAAGVVIVTIIGISLIVEAMVR